MGDEDPHTNLHLEVLESREAKYKLPKQYHVIWKNNGPAELGQAGDASTAVHCCTQLHHTFHFHHPFPLTTIYAPPSCNRQHGVRSAVHQVP